MLIKISEEEYLSHTEAYDGVCLSCGEFTCGEVEPDACNYHCESCGKSEVFGVEEALMMGKLELNDQIMISKRQLLKAKSDNLKRLAKYLGLNIKNMSSKQTARLLYWRITRR